jgi:hypothetical protein
MITARDYSIWVSESRWADPDPVRILKWLTVVFRKKCLTPTLDSRQGLVGLYGIDTGTGTDRLVVQECKSCAF